MLARIEKEEKNKMKTIQDIIELFKKEFNFLSDKFFIYNIPLAEAKDSKAEHIWKPGVYVFWQPARGVIKVGRHLTNSRKRAFEHIRDDTGGKMRILDSDPSARLLLFNVINQDDFHWVAALEIFFEVELKPETNSERLG